MRSLFETCLDWLFPPHCPACGAPGDPRRLCPPCLASVVRWPTDERWAAADAARPRRWSSLRYADPVRAMLVRAKYAADPVALPALAALLAEEAHRELGACPIDLVVALPTSRDRERMRGFNQAFWLAQPIARRLQRPLVRGRLRRTRKTPPQVGQSRVTRRRQLTGAFAARGVSGLTVLLVDDVETTGASLAEATKALREAGALEVLALTLCRADEALA